ncbi:MAG: transposase [bacterium]|nr:transposase [bacterium]
MNYAIGIDVGKKEMVACIRSSDGLGAPTISFPNTTLGTKQFLGKLEEQSLPHDTPILLESTGPYHWQAAYQMTQAKWRVRLMNPILTKRIARHSIRKRKTDKIDAGHLALLASQGYGYVFQETQEWAKEKALIRHYWKLRTAMVNFTRHEDYLRTYRGITGTSVARYLLKQSDILRKKIINLFEKGNDLRYLDSIPGITPMLAVTILAELRPLSRFQRIEQVIAYAGLDPGIKQSGGKPAKFTKLSKRGSPTLRKMLYYAAFGCFMRPPFNVLYTGYKKRGLHHTAALCILSRKILRISVALLKKREVFKSEYVDRT